MTAKFKDPETGEVFDILEFSRTAFENCAYIRVEANCKELSVFDYIYTYPHEAAALMGYEVVDDETVLTKTDGKNESLEVNMDKPRICEVLGVEVGERFELGNTGIILLVNDDGLLHIGLSHGAHKETDMNVNYLVKAINDPDRIIRKPRFTEQEVEDAKAVRRVLGHEYRLERTPEGTISFGGIILSAQLFPSIHPGQSYTLDEIIGGAE